MDNMKNCIYDLLKDEGTFAYNPTESEVDINLDNVVNFPFPSPEVTLCINDVEISKRSRLFTANCYANDRKVSISGRYEEYTTIPVSRRNIRAGDTISEDDLDMYRISAAKVNKNVIRSMDELIGKNARSFLYPFLPIYRDNIKSVDVVKRNDLVTLVYRNGDLTITTEGLALEAGAISDSIRVKNTKSNVVVQGVVAGDRTVEVGGQQPNTTPTPSE
jgi:flagella basal body P-ring formation protein FlgA